MPNALVTGVSRRAGIGWAVAQRLCADGWAVSASGWPTHDSEQPWGADAKEPDLPGVIWAPANLAKEKAPRRLVAEHVARHGSLDALVAVHARSSRQNLEMVTAGELKGVLLAGYGLN